jgi:hypothetical protein
MSEIAACLALPVPWEFNGQTYKVAGRDFEVEGLFEVWVEGQALAAILRHEKTLGPAGVALQMDGWRRECAGQVYHWDGLECWQARVSLPGRKHLAALQLTKGSGGSLEENRGVVEEAFADAAEGGARQTLEAAIERANSDPNLPKPWRRRAARA